MRASSRGLISAVGEKKVLYIRLNFSDDLTQPITETTATERMQEVSHFFRTHSYGKCWMKSTVTPLLTFPSLKSAYFSTNSAGLVTWDPQRMLTDALDVARAAGFSPGDYDLHLLRFNAPFYQSWGYIGTSGAWLVTSDVPTTAHEIGHNLGLNHANSWSGPLNGPGANKEYDDLYDIMGYPYRFDLAGFHTINKTALGWLDESHTMRVTNSGVYRLYAHDTNQPVAHRTYALRIKKDDERDYWIEKRQRFDFSDEMKSSGVLAYWDSWSESNYGTQLLDPSPAEGWGLPIHDLLSDRVAGLRVIPLRQAEDRSYIEVAVFLGNAPLTILPGLIHFAGLPNQNYNLQSSTDLRSWTNVKQFSAPDGEFVLPVSANTKGLFYRVQPAQ